MVIIMVRNTNLDLNNHLFEQLERLNDDELTDEALEKEVKRSKALTDVSNKIIDNSKLALEASKFRAEYTGVVNVPDTIERNLIGDDDE